MESNLILNKRTEMNLTGVVKVRSTEPHIVSAVLSDGNVLIGGANLSVQHLDLKEGVLQVQGRIDSIRYTKGTARSFSFKNMFR